MLSSSFGTSGTGPSTGPRARPRAHGPTGPDVEETIAILFGISSWALILEYLLPLFLALYLAYLLTRG